MFVTFRISILSVILVVVGDDPIFKKLLNFVVKDIVEFVAADEVQAMHFDKELLLQNPLEELSFGANSLEL